MIGAASDEQRLTAGYAICGVRRCGSNFLCSLLSSTERLGQPAEYFLEDPAWTVPGEMFDRARALDAIRDGASANGVYGVKLFPDGFEMMKRTDWMAAFPNMSFVFLRRRGMLAQAVSAARAVQTGQWTSLKKQHAVPTYSADLIGAQLRMVALAEARWRVFFARNAIAPLELMYEDVVAQPQEAVDAIAKQVGIPAPVPIDWDRVRLEKQRDDQSAQWLERYVSEHGDRTYIDDLVNLPLTRWAAVRWPQTAKAFKKLLGSGR